MDRLILDKKCDEILNELSQKGYKIDCFSVKGQGKATIDCDIAIDVKNYDGNFNHELLFKTVNKPYGEIVFPDLTRLKFNI